MGNKKRNKAGSHRSLQAITLCISTAMVLILLGLVMLTVFTARNLSAYAKESLTVTLVLAEDTSEPEAQQICQKVKSLPYIAGLHYISKDEVLKETTKSMGVDPGEFIDVNPFTASIDLQLLPEYANNDSIKWISKQLLKIKKVSDMDYRPELIETVNKRLSQIGLVLLVLAVLLTIISFSLINNTIRLSVYSRRFSIHTMKLVGASWGFIRSPFLTKAIGQGLISACLAITVLGGGLYALNQYEPDMQKFIDYRVMAITGGIIMVFGILITSFCAWLSVNKFLRMKAGDLYKI